MNNHRADDYPWLERLLREWTDPDEIPALGFGLQDLAVAHPDPITAPALLAHYERGPCSFCRLHTVTALRRLGGAPGWLLEECRYDANLEPREEVRKEEPGE